MHPAEAIDADAILLESGRLEKELGICRHTNVGDSQGGGVEAVSLAEAVREQRHRAQRACRAI